MINHPPTHTSPVRVERSGLRGLMVDDAETRLSEVTKKLEHANRKLGIAAREHNSRRLVTNEMSKYMSRVNAICKKHGGPDGSDWGEQLKWLGEQLAADGWDVVLPDLRAHGASGGKYITWGAKDKRDIKTVVETLIAERLISPRLYAMGASLGGCVAVQYAAYDSRCHGVLALAAPTGVNGVARRMYPLATEGWLARTIVSAGQIADFDPADASAVEAVGKLKCPLILVHGRLDIIVPYSHSERIYAAATGPRKLISLPLATHTTIQIGRNGLGFLRFRRMPRRPWRCPLSPTRWMGCMLHPWRGRRMRPCGTNPRMEPQKRPPPTPTFPVPYVTTRGKALVWFGPRVPPRQEKRPRNHASRPIPEPNAGSVSPLAPVNAT